MVGSAGYSESGNRLTVLNGQSRGQAASKHPINSCVLDVPSPPQSEQRRSLHISFPAAPWQSPALFWPWHQGAHVFPESGSPQEVPRVALVQRSLAGCCPGIKFLAKCLEL